jgi:ribosome-associated protein
MITSTFDDFLPMRVASTKTPSDDADAPPQRPSKTQLKKAMHELQQLGEALTELSDGQLGTLPLPESLRDAVREFQHTRSHEGRRRQLQYIGKLMRATDIAPIREAVDASRLGPAREALALHEAEHWRSELIASDSALTAWMATHPHSDQQQLRILIRAARKDALVPEGPSAAARKGRAYRELFQFIRRES